MRIFHLFSSIRVISIGGMPDIVGRAGKHVIVGTEEAIIIIVRHS
jgi:hypothetical protein